MKRRTVAIVAATLALVGLGTFGVVHMASSRSASNAVVATLKPTTCDDAYRALKLAPSQITTARSVCLTQALQISGELSGTVAQAFPVQADGVAPTQMCSVPKRWSGFPQAMLAIVLSKKAYRLRISVPGTSAHRAMTVSAARGVVELVSIADPKADWNQATGTVSVNADGITGTIDADVVRDIPGVKPAHITGQWACGAPLPVPTFDASVPCASFYALNQLQPADVARMKASACQVEDLTFTGDINAHLDRAITDTAISPHTGYGGDNYCGSVGEEYTATLKFSIGDESFLLDLDVQNYPAVAPGQYSAQTSGSSVGAVLFLGHADPNNQGVFVTDDRVSWSGSAGAFTLAPDMKSGTLDATFSGLDGGSGSSVQVKGMWRCAA